MGKDAEDKDRTRSILRGEALKTAVLGGGPGGLTAALELLRRGQAVTLFERGRIGEGIHCGECLFDSFGRLGAPPAAVSLPVRRLLFRIEQEHERPLKNFERLWMVDRRLWQQGLARQAVSLGLDLRENTRIHGADLAGLADRFDYVVDASGAPSVTSVAYGFAPEYLDGCFVAVQQVLQGDFSSYRNALKVGFLPDTHGYYWVFPKDDTTANVGVALNIGEVRKGRDLKAMMTSVIRREELQDAVVLKRVAGILPAKVVTQVRHGNILLVGEAAGLTSPLHGEGIDLACVSAQLAADSILGGEEALQQYDAKLRELVEEKWRKEKLIVDFWQSITFQRFDALVRALCTEDKLLFARTTLKSPAMMQYAWQWLRYQRAAGSARRRWPKQ